MSTTLFIKLLTAERTKYSMLHYSKTKKSVFVLYFNKSLRNLIYYSKMYFVIKPYNANRFLITRFYIIYSYNYIVII